MGRGLENHGVHGWVRMGRGLRRGEKGSLLPRDGDGGEAVGGGEWGIRLALMLFVILALPV